MEHCRCGWERPLIATTLADGSLPPPIVVVYLCPRCGEPHICGERQAPDAAALARLQAAWHASRGGQ